MVPGFYFEVAYKLFYEYCRNIINVSLMDDFPPSPLLSGITQDKQKQHL